MNFDAAIDEDLLERVAMAEAFLAAARHPALHIHAAVPAELPPLLRAMLAEVTERHTVRVNRFMAEELAVVLSLAELQAARTEFERRAAWADSDLEARIKVAYNGRIDTLVVDMQPVLRDEIRAVVDRFARGG